MFEVDTLIKARYPLLYIVSAEEDRVIKSIRQTLPDMTSLMVYSITKGLQVVSTTSEGVLTAPGTSFKPAEVLTHIEKTAKGSGVVILKDFHPYFSDPVIVRGVRDVAESFRNGEHAKTLIILSPVQTIPPELEKMIAICDWALPTRGEIASLAKAAGGGSDPSESTIDAAMGLSLFEAENAFAKSLILAKHTLDPKTILEEKKQIIRKSGLLEYIETPKDHSHVGGLGAAKRWLAKRANAFSQKAKDFGLPAPKGVVVIGPPGCGKSLIAKCTGNAWGMPLLKLDLGKVFQGLVGSSEENMRKVLKTAEAVAPCILFIDEADKALAGTASSGQTDGGTTSRVFGAFLNWLQEHTAPVFVVMTANSVEQLPPELTRKGRIDEIFFVDLPNKSERKAIFEIQIQAVKREPKTYDLDLLSDMTDGYSGAEIEQIVCSALFDAFDASESLTPGHLVASCKRMVPQSKSASAAIEKLREWARERAIAASDPEPVSKGRFSKSS